MTKQMRKATLAGAFGVGGCGSEASGRDGVWTGFGTTLSPMLVSWVILADPFFGRSLDVFRIYFTTLTGAGGRPFTVAAPDPNGDGFVQIMNLGNAPSNGDGRVGSASRLSGCIACLSHWR